MRLRADTAELVIVDQLVYCAMLAADRAFRVPAQFQLAETHAQGVEQKQAAHQRLSLAEDQFHDLGGLNHPNDAGQDAEHSALCAAGNEPGRRRLRIEAAIARGPRHAKHGSLTFKAEDAAVDIGLSQQHAGVIYEVARREVIGPVGDNVVVLEDLQGVFRCQLCVVELHLYIGVQRLQAVPGGLQFRLSHGLCGVQDLPLEIGQVDNVEIDNAELTHTRRRQIQRERRTEAAGPNREHSRRLQFQLPFHAHFGHDQMTAVAQDLVRP